MYVQTCMTPSIFGYVNTVCYKKNSCAYKRKIQTCDYFHTWTGIYTCVYFKEEKKNFVLKSSPNKAFFSQNYVNSENSYTKLIFQDFFLARKFYMHGYWFLRTLKAEYTIKYLERKKNKIWSQSDLFLEHNFLCIFTVIPRTYIRKLHWKLPVLV